MMKKRESFNNRWGFILACIGSAVGMGNLWMFPTRVSMYGGGSYLLPYFIFVALIGFTGVIGEMSFGRATKSGPVDAFGTACEMRGHKRIGRVLGYIPVFGSLAMAIGYTVVMGWILKYMIGSFTGTTLAPADANGFGTEFGSMATSFGNNLWQIIALMIGFAILVFGVSLGIELANKIMMPVFFCLFVILGIYVAFQPGAVDGYKYIFQIDPKALADPKTWIFALGQAFFSLSVAGNGTLIYGSYLSDKEDIPAAAGRVALFDTLAALLAAMVIIPAMATTGARLNQGGPGLMFIYLPALFKSMPGGYLIAIIFFVAVFFCRSLLPHQPLRGTNRNSTRAFPPGPEGILWYHCHYRSGNLHLYPRYCIQLDGSSVYLYLPSWSRSGRSYVLLGMRSEICRNTGKYRQNKTFY